MVRMFSSAQAYFMNSTVGEKQKTKAKQIWHAQSEVDMHGSWYSTRTTQSLKAWAWRCRIHFICPAPVPRQIWESNFLMYEEKPILWLLSKNSYENHMTRPEIHVFIHTWWTQMKIIKNTTTFWSSSFDQNVHSDFQVKACGTQDTWHNIIGHPTTAIWAQRLYK